MNICSWTCYNLFAAIPYTGTERGDSHERSDVLPYFGRGWSIRKLHKQMAGSKEVKGRQPKE